MAFPDLTIMYAAVRSIFSNCFSGATDQNLQLRWMNKENDLNLPRVITFEAMHEVVTFATGELQNLVIHGNKGSNPGLPLTDAQKKADAIKKEQDKKAKAAAAYGKGGPGESSHGAPGGKGQGGGKPGPQQSTILSTTLKCSSWSLKSISR